MASDISCNLYNFGLISCVYVGMMTYHFLVSKFCGFVPVHFFTFPEFSLFLNVSQTIM
jgi:hypothetical protein